MASAQLQEQLLLLRDMTERLGVLHEAQILQLKMWPLVAAPHAKSAECKIDQVGRRIEINLTLGRKKAPKNLPTLLKGLDESVKWLLGADWKTEVWAKEKLLWPV